MSKGKVKWSLKGEREDFEAAQNYLSLVASETDAAQLISGLRAAPHVEYAAKDLLRAAELPLLPQDEPHVADDLKTIGKGKPLTAVLLVRGDFGAGLPLMVADGYHRICAIIHFDESAPVPCRIVSAGSRLPQVKRRRSS